MVSGYSSGFHAMRLFVFPLITLAVLAGGFSEEPREAQMQQAFETSLSIQVRNTLDFVAEVSGAEAVEKIREAGSDRFAIRSFRKLDCSRADGAGYLCGFAVDIELMNGRLERRMDGRFSPNSLGGLAFAEGI
jgi:hypothetical protein